MKTPKSAFVSFLLVFFVAGIAKSDISETIKPPKNVIHVTLQQAIQDPGLVAAMIQQLDPGFLGINHQTYTVSVIYQNYIFKITGTYEEWKLFFSPKWDPLSESDTITVGPSLD